VRLATGYLSRDRFLTELALDPPAATSDESGPGSLDEDYLILSTIHSAKGQEWSAVSVLNVVDGCIPSDMATGNAAEIEEGAAPALRGDDASPALPAPARAAALLRHPADELGDRHMYARSAASCRNRSATASSTSVRGRAAAAEAEAAALPPVDIGRSSAR
jgi:DNA helicase-2/ATP-dependent DNA helicase PcrA